MDKCFCRSEGFCEIQSKALYAQYLKEVSIYAVAVILRCKMRERGLQYLVKICDGQLKNLKLHLGSDISQCGRAVGNFKEWLESS